VALDLAVPDAVEQVIAAPGDREIGFCVYVAAGIHIGPFLDGPAARDRQMLTVNCVAPALLVHHFGRGMRARRRGGIVLMASLSGF
jgi:hypothetical protein